MPNRPFEEFVAALRRAKLDPTPREMAEILWLASRIDVDVDETHAHGAARDNRERADGLKLRDETLPGTPGIERLAEGAGSVVPEVRGVGQGATRTFRAARFRSPAASALPDPRGLAQAIRPLMRRVDSRTEFVLDEEATVRRMADEGLPNLVLRPARSRWLDLVLIVDESPTLAPWRRTLVELRDLLAGYGIFRDVLALSMETLESGEARLFRGLAGAGGRRRQCGLGEVLAPGDARLILLLSDTMSAGWLRGTMAEAIGRWGRVHAVALTQLLPRDLWQRAPLGVPVVRFRYPVPGAPNRQLDEATASGEDLQSAMALPVFSLERRSLANWASAFAARRHASATGFYLTTQPLPESGDGAPESESGAMERYSLFTRFASSEARELMTYLAAVPLTLPVMRLVQRAMIEEPHPAQIAEILLSGLFVVTAPGKSEEDTLYEFHDEVRDLLGSGLSHAAALRVLDEVSKYVNRHLDTALDFGALVLAEEGDLEVELPEKVRPFARIAAETMARYLPPGARMQPIQAPPADEEPVSELDSSSVPGDPGKPADSIEPERGSAPIETAGSQAREVLQTAVNPMDRAEMILIPAGEFLMGSKEYDDEKPRHPVTLDAYWIYKCPVTVSQFRAFCETKPKIDGEPLIYDWEERRPQWGWRDDHPMVNVSWHEASAYCAWAGGALPTEAQWEKAARGTDGRQYPWGDEWDPEKCRCSKKEAGDARSTGPAGGIPEGASPFGVLDMAGNVWEWCRDWYGENYYQNSQKENPDGPEEGDSRVLRGGSWNSYHPDFFRCANRGRYFPTNRSDYFGFRCVLRSDTS